MIIDINYREIRFSYLNTHFLKVKKGELLLIPSLNEEITTILSKSSDFMKSLNETKKTLSNKNQIKESNNNILYLYNDIQELVSEIIYEIIQMNSRVFFIIHTR